MLTKAGEHAASLAVSAEAERYFERALDLTDDTLSLAGLHERAGQMARRAGDFQTARGHFETAIELSRLSRR